MSCKFCDILAGKVPASFVYRDDCVAAFMDIQPVNTGHILVVPVSHAVGLDDLEEKDGSAVFLMAQRIACAIKQSGLRCEGVNLFLADGEAAMQDVFHVHLHVIPRFEGDGFGLELPESYSQKPARESLDATSESVRTALKPSAEGPAKSGGVTPTGAPPLWSSA